MNKQLFFCLALSVLAAAAVARPAEAYVWWGAKWAQESLGDPVYPTYTDDNLLDGVLRDSRRNPVSESEIRNGVEEALQLEAGFHGHLFVSAGGLEEVESHHREGNGVVSVELRRVGFSSV